MGFFGELLGEAIGLGVDLLLSPSNSTTPTVESTEEKTNDETINALKYISQGKDNNGKTENVDFTCDFINNLKFSLSDSKKKNIAIESTLNLLLNGWKLSNTAVLNGSNSIFSFTKNITMNDMPLACALFKNNEIILCFPAVEDNKEKFANLKNRICENEKLRLVRQTENFEEYERQSENKLFHFLTTDDFLFIHYGSDNGYKICGKLEKKSYSDMFNFFEDEAGCHYFKQKISGHPYFEVALTYLTLTQNGKKSFDMLSEKMDKQSYEEFSNKFWKYSLLKKGKDIEAFLAKNFEKSVVSKNTILHFQHQASYNDYQVPYVSEDTDDELLTKILLKWNDIFTREIDVLSVTTDCTNTNWFHEGKYHSSGDQTEKEILEDENISYKFEKGEIIRRQRKITYSNQKTIFYRIEYIGSGGQILIFEQDFFMLKLSFNSNERPSAVLHINKIESLDTYIPNFSKNFSRFIGHFDSLKNTQKKDLLNSLDDL